MVEVAAELKAVVAGRDIDDDGGALFRLDNGASGLLAASQVCTGAANGLRIEVYGDKASLHWSHGDPNTLTIGRRGEPDLTLNPGSNIEYLSSAATARCRTPGGHPEGFIEAFSNLYVDFANAVRAYPEPVDNVCATVGDGVRAMRFIRATINSTNNGSAWTKI